MLNFTNGLPENKFVFKRSFSLLFLIFALSATQNLQANQIILVNSSKSEQSQDRTERFLGGPDVALPVAKFNHQGERIHLYQTDIPLIFQDEQRRAWVLTNPEESQNDKRKYVPWSEATDQQRRQAGHLSHSKTPGVLVDLTGQEWIRIPRGDQAQDLKDGPKLEYRFIRIELASAESIYQSFTQDLKGNIPLQSLKALPVELLKFSAAGFVVQMTSCFGPSAVRLHMNMSPSPYNPNCVDQFINHLMDPRGWVGFYFFMIGHRYTNKALMQATLKTAAILADKNIIPNNKIPRIRAAMSPLFGYLGMAAGGITSHIASHFLYSPEWAECVKNVPKNLSSFYDSFNASNMSSIDAKQGPCGAAFNSFLSMDSMWHDVFAGSITLIAGAGAASVTQKLLGYSVEQISKLRAGQTTNGFRILGQRAISGPSANFFLRSVTVMRSFAVFGGVPGIVVTATTTVGQFVLFLAWDEILRDPVHKLYYENRSSARSTDAVQMIKKGLPSTPSFEIDKKNFPLDCQKTETAPLQTEMMLLPGIPSQELIVTEKCDSPLLNGIKAFGSAAKLHRDKVLLHKFNAASNNWTTTISDYLKTYEVSKNLILYVYRKRDKAAESKQSVAMNWTLSAHYLRHLWMDTLNQYSSELRERDFKHLYSYLEAEAELPGRVGELKIEAEEGEKLTPPKRPIFKNVVLPVLERPEESLVHLIEQLKNISDESKAIQWLTGLQKATEDLYRRHLNPSSSIVATVCRHISCRALRLTHSIILPKTPPPSTPTHIYLKDNLEFLGKLAQSAQYDLESVFKTFDQLFCSAKENFEFSGGTGRAEVMTPPSLILFPKKSDSNGVELSRRNYFITNCHTREGGATSSAANDLIRVWAHNGRLYSDPLSLVMDSSSVLNPGSTGIDAKAWWQENAFRPTSRSLWTWTESYQSLVQAEVLSKVPALPKSSVSNPSEMKDYLNLFSYLASAKKVEDYHSMVFSSDNSRGKLAESYMAEFSMALGILRASPSLSNESKEILTQLEQQFALFVLGLNLPRYDMVQLKAFWDSYTSAVLGSGADRDDLGNLSERKNQELFAILASPASYKFSNSSFRNIQQLLPRAFQAITQTEIGKIDPKLREEWQKGDIKPEVAWNYPDNVFKQYIVYTLLNINTSKLVGEIGALYAKLGLRPLAALPMDYK